MNPKYRFQLQKYSANPPSKITCPNCKTAEKFTRYVDTVTDLVIADNVGRCDREDSCGYHYTPKKYFEDNPDAYLRIINGVPPSSKPQTVASEVIEVKYIDSSYVEDSLSRVDDSHLFRFLEGYFGQDAVKNVFEDYRVGVSGNWDIHDNFSTLFWQIDVEGRVRQCKVIHYDQDTGKRKREDGACYFLGNRMNIDSGEFVQTLFGAHLLPKYPNKKVGIVESEKTALVMALSYPDFLWLATGGAHGCKWSDEQAYSILEGRDIVFFPDLGMYDKWATKASKIKLRSGRIRVSDCMERKATPEQINQGLDLADVVLYRLEAEAASINPDVIR
jgi:hypothetical protein